MLELVVLSTSEYLLIKNLEKDQRMFQLKINVFNNWPLNFKNKSNKTEKVMELTLCQIKYQFNQPELKVNKIFNYD